MSGQGSTEGRYGPARPIVRLCRICGERLPAGVALHPPCAEHHRKQLEQKLVERRKTRRETGQ